MADEVLNNTEEQSQELEREQVLQQEQAQALEREQALEQERAQALEQELVQHAADMIDESYSDLDIQVPHEFGGEIMEAPPIDAYEDAYRGDDYPYEQPDNPFANSASQHQNNVIDDIMATVPAQAAPEPEVSKPEPEVAPAVQAALPANEPAPAVTEKAPKPAAAAKPIDPSERNAILEKLNGATSLSEEKLVKLLDEELGRERTEKFMDAVDRYTNANPDKLHSIPVDFIIKRLDNLSAKTFSKDRIADLSLSERALNLDDSSAMSMKEEVKNTAPPRNKNESEMNNRDRERSREAVAEHQPIESNGLANAVNSLMMRFGGKNKAPTVDSVVGANSSLKPTDTMNPSYSQEARRNYTKEMHQQMQSIHDLCVGVEKNNTPKNRREMFRSMEQVDANLKKGEAILSDSTSFESPSEFKKFTDSARLLRSKMSDLKRNKVVGEDNEAFKSLFETLKKAITETLDKVASFFKSEEKSQSKGLSAGPGM